MKTLMKCFSCLLSIVLCLHLATSFNVDELCARRCLYGRGGVLCNCNAIHFSGKRSSQAAYITVNTHQDSSDSPHDHSLHEKSFTFPGNSLFESLLRTNQDSHLHRTSFGSQNGILDESLTSLSLDKLLSRLDQESDMVNTSPRSAIDDTNEMVTYTLPGLVLHNTHAQIPDEDEETEAMLERRNEAASKIKEIMGHSKSTSTSDSNFSADLLDDFVDDRQNDPSRQPLVRLQDVLQRVHERS